MDVEDSAGNVCHDFLEEGVLPDQQGRKQENKFVIILLKDYRGILLLMPVYTPLCTVCLQAQRLDLHLIFSTVKCSNI